MQISATVTVVSTYFRLLAAVALSLVALAASAADPSADSSREVQLAKAERARGGNFGQFINFDNERRAFPFYAYAEAAAKAQQEAPRESALDHMVASAGPSRASLMSDVAGSMTLTAAMHVPVNSVANFNWTVATMALGVISLLTPSDPRSKAARSFSEEDAKLWMAAEVQRLLAVTTPSLSFVKMAPDARDPADLYAEIRAGEDFIEGLGLGCEPALWHGSETPAFMGAAYGVYNYTRKFVCGYGEGEVVAEQDAGVEVKDLAVVSFTTGEPRVRFSLSNLPQMARMAKLLGAQSGQDMGMLAYEAVREHIPPEWTAIITAPNANGEMTVFVVQDGQRFEFPPVPQKRK